MEMELKKEQYERISECFPKQRKPAKISNLEVLNAELYQVENECIVVTITPRRLGILTSIEEHTLFLAT